MAEPERGDPWAGLAAGWGITSTLIAGILVGGGLGYLIDRLAGTSRAFLAIGVILGAVAGIYAVYLTYGRGQDGEG